MKTLDKLETKKQFAASLRKMIQLFLQEKDFWRLYTMLALQPDMAQKFQKEAMCVHAAIS